MPIPFLETIILGSPDIDPSTLDELVIVSDDTTCIRILAVAGVALPTETPPYNKHIARFAWNTPEGDFQALAFYEYGHSKPADNGYTVILLPSSIDAVSVAAVFALIIKLTAANAADLAAA